MLTIFFLHFYAGVVLFVTSDRNRKEQTMLRDLTPDSRTVELNTASIGVDESWLSFSNLASCSLTHTDIISTFAFELHAEESIWSEGQRGLFYSICYSIP